GRRPRIGLVLAGGGARGLGHVGVIRLLEELRVPVDCIVGTSMGSIVAGLYAAGYTSREMEDWLRECDWDHLLSDSLPRPQRGYRTKTEELDTPRWFEFGVDRSGLKVPNALISGQNLLVALREKTDFVGAGRSFDDLPVRYRAVATDIETGAMVVLDRGALADAMRASMAVPGAFAPYTIDGRVLIDGFASRNLPVSVVREMGVDVIIAVDVRAELLPRTN
ncbi:MAG TPA: patatin-like phospholipase family protein, partial [Opitutaceae bacterium]|nr:patatin-like phospholipase family protein [Opitutaceae bacterium]